MASALDYLTKYIPPTTARELSLDWADIERQLGIGLPSDYKFLVTAYGQGSFDRFLWILQPSGTNKHLDLLSLRDALLSALRVLRDSGEAVPFRVDHDDAELMPWAITDNGDVCYWVTSSAEEPDNWTVAINEARGPKWSRFDLSASEFLVGVLFGRLRVGVFPDDFPSDSPSFESAPPEPR